VYVSQDPNSMFTHSFLSPRWLVSFAVQKLKAIAKPWGLIGRTGLRVK
jgi:hypothetical protein